MNKPLLVRISFAAVAIGLPVGTVAANVESPVNREFTEGGLCNDELGCRSGAVKCADGVLTLPSGGQAAYTCYTTLNEE